jgi:F420H(2)-dependent quinone reductase
MAVMGTRHPARPRWKAWNAVTLWILHTPVLERLAERQVCELRFRARRSGREIVLPVMYAQHDDMIVVLVGGPERKRWWRNFIRPHRVEVLLRGVLRSGTGHVVSPGSAQRADAARIYGGRFPDLAVEDDPLVVIDLDPAS